MLLLTLALVVAGRAVPAWLKTVSDGLLSHLALLFVPAGVGLMVHFELLSREWLVMIVTLIISTGLTMAVTGWVFQKIMRSRGGEHD
jgi:holin-like protein